MKKTFVAAAVLGAFAASAMAADVTLYGVIDTGLHYNNTKVTGESAVNTFDMKSGVSAGNRWGLKGAEDLGNGYKVGFVLENGFSEDDGKLGNGGRLFGREANLYVASDFGTLSFGRVGALTSGAGSYDQLKYTPFATGWGNTATKANFMIGDRDRMDNTVTYVAPDFAGFKVLAQYSFNRDGQETSGNERQNDRYAALGAAYKNGAFQSALVVDTVMHDYDSLNQKDSLGVTLGASYDFEVVKVFALGQYGKNENKFGGLSNRGYVAYNQKSDNLTNRKAVYVQDEGVTGYMFQLGMTAPVLGGKAYAAVSYSDAETDSDADVGVAGAFGAASKTADSKVIHSQDFKGYGVAVGYTYPMSKRTYLYTYAGYEQLKTKEAGESVKEKNTEFGFGMVHNF